MGADERFSTTFFRFLLLLLILASLLALSTFTSTQKCTRSVKLRNSATYVMNFIINNAINIFMSLISGHSFLFAWTYEFATMDLEVFTWNVWVLRRVANYAVPVHVLQDGLYSWSIWRDAVFCFDVHSGVRRAHLIVWFYRHVFILEFCFCSTCLLHTSAILDQTYVTRRFTAVALAEQFYSCYISIQHSSDSWLAKGISNFLSLLYIKKFLGMNEYRNIIFTVILKNSNIYHISVILLVCRMCLIN